jgi:general secretion pathway protein I
MTFSPRRSRTIRMPRRTRRNAFTLLEVILALAILVGSLAIIGELTDQGLVGARRAATLAEAQLICESKLAEVAAGLLPATAVGPVPLETDPAWNYTIAVVPQLDVGLISVQVTVAENLPPEQRPTDFTLVRWMIDPIVLAEEAAMESSAAAAETTP